MIKKCLKDSSRYLIFNSFVYCKSAHANSVIQEVSNNLPLPLFNCVVKYRLKCIDLVTWRSWGGV